jgi:thiamine-monophosphate kinase
MEPVSEESFYDLIDRAFPKEHAALLLPRGDDCAHIKTPGELVVSTDLFLESVHFRKRYFTPGDIGHKALAVNLSDIAAMGARPMGFSLGLMVPEDLDANFWNELFTGMAELAAQFDLMLTGGDVSRADRLGFSLTIWGRPGPKGRVLRRGGKPGSVLVLLGRPGLARTGLSLLEEGEDRDAPGYERAVEAHLRPRPLVNEGVGLAGMNGVHGAMDVSDGLAADLPKFLGGLGADLRIKTDSLHKELVSYCAERDLDPAEFAVLGGEDYGLLTAVTPEAAERLLKLPDARIIGKVRGKPGLSLNGEPFDKKGFDHFSRRGE